jgi:hypothetical protein
MENNRRDILILFLIFLGIPFLGYMLYSGNNGSLYGYYLTGYYLVVILLFSFSVSFLWKSKIGKIMIFIFLILFLKNNLLKTITKLKTDILDSKEIVLQNQIIALNWIKYDAGDKEFNVDIYVPPVIPHSYNYLMTWMDIKQQENQVKLLYTLYEDDPPHPERLEAWLKRQDEIGKVLYQESFAGITVQKRERLDKK